MQIYIINTDHVLVLYALILAEIVAVRCSNFGKVYTDTLTIDINTEIMKNDEIKLYFA